MVQKIRGIPSQSPEVTFNLILVFSDLLTLILLFRKIYVEKALSTNFILRAFQKLIRLCPLKSTCKFLSHDNSIKFALSLIDKEKNLFLQRMLTKYLIYEENIFFYICLTDVNGSGVFGTVISTCVVTAWRILSTFKPIVQRIPRLDPISDQL